MQPLRSLSFLLLCLPIALFAQLSGTYTIGATGTYTTFNAAVTALVAQGVSAPVLFEVEDGTYTELVQLPSIPGTSATNTITFRGQSLDSAAVSLVWPTGLATPTLRFNGADHVTFEHLTIERTGTSTLPGSCVDWGGAVGNAATRSTHITFSSCRFRTTSNQTTTVLAKGLVQNNEEQVRFLGCRFEGGPTALQWNMNVAQLALEVDRCTFTGQRLRCIQLIDPGTGQPAVRIQENTFNSPTLTGAITVDVAHNAAQLLIARNRIFCTTTNGIALSLAVNGVDPTITVVRNNMIIGGLNARGILLSGATNGLGIVYNAVSTSLGRGVEITASGAGNWFVGNAVRSTLHPFYHSGVLTFSVIDHNAFHANGSSWVFWNGTNYADIHTLRCATGQHLRSIQSDPRFVDTATDLHVLPDSPCLGQGIPLPGMLEDFDGDARAWPTLSAPDIGADELNGVCAGLAGTYIIGTSGGAHFPSFTAAVVQLGACGVTGPVVFEVENGTYTERLLLGHVAGASTTNTITFRGQTLDSTLVILQVASLSSTLSAPNHLVRCYGCGHIRFEHMTLNRTGTAGFARVVEVDPSCRPVIDLRFDHCRLSNGGGATTNASLIIRNSELLSTTASCRVGSCELLGGFYGVEWTKLGAGVIDTVSIAHSRCAAGSNGFRISNSNGPVTLHANDVVFSGTRGIELSNADGPVVVSANRITGGMTTANGLMLAGLEPPLSVRSRIVNNAITVTGSAIVMIGLNTRLDVVHNSARARGTNGQGLRATASSPPIDVNLLNNVFSSEDDVALSFNLVGITAQYNCFERTSTGPLVTWNNIPYTTIAALQAGSGTHSASLQTDPRFFDPLSDLHAYAMELDGATLPFPGITTDGDGEPRDTTTPDIGAFEFTPQLWNESLATCGATDPITSTGSGQDQWIYQDRKVVARFNDNGQVLGTVNMNVYLHSGPVRQSLLGQHYLDRNWQLTTQNPITTGAILRLFYSGDEFVPFAAADPTVNVAADAGVAQYAGGGENCSLTDNATTGAAWQAHFPASPAAEPRIQALGGTFGYTAVLQTDGELYISGQASSLPVELLSFTAERISPANVQLSWSTATERNNAGFEVWRQVEGEAAFSMVAWVDGAGDSQQLLEYHHADNNPATQVSYYQLRKVDHDGTSAWSPVVAVQGSAPSGLVVIPNPAHGHFTLRGADELQGPVELRDASGRLIRTGLPYTTFDLSGIAPGSYLVCLPASDHPPVRLLVQ